MKLENRRLPLPIMLIQKSRMSGNVISGLTLRIQWSDENPLTPGGLMRMARIFEGSPLNSGFQSSGFPTLGRQKVVAVR
jgi:hypothetical protein